MHITGIFSVFFHGLHRADARRKAAQKQRGIEFNAVCAAFFGLYGVFKTATANLKQYFFFHIYTNFRLFVLSAAL